MPNEPTKIQLYQRVIRAQNTRHLKVPKAEFSTKNREPVSRI